MAASGRNVFAGFLVGLCLPACVAASAGTATKVLGSECGFSVEVPESLALVRDAETEEPWCQLIAAEPEATPFVNRISRMHWASLQKLPPEDPARSGAFFWLAPLKAVQPILRKSYRDDRNGYRQVVLGKPVVRRAVRDGRSEVTVRSRLKVTWLSPVDGKTKEETTEDFECVDAAISDSAAVVLLNWCQSSDASVAAPPAPLIATIRPTMR